VTGFGGFALLTSCARTEWNENTICLQQTNESQIESVFFCQPFSKVTHLPLYTGTPSFIYRNAASLSQQKQLAIRAFNFCMHLMATHAPRATNNKHLEH
jgi:hypothetical protein